MKKTQAKSEQKSDITPVQSRMARGALEWGIRDLAKAAEISHDTVVRFERGDELRESTVAAVVRAFEKAGVEFISENGGGAGVRLRKRGRR